MTDDQNAHRMPAGEDHSDDEEIIELTDEIVAPPEAHEEIIELTDEITPSSDSPEESAEPEKPQSAGDLTGARMDGAEEPYDFASVLGLELEPEGGVSPEPVKIEDRGPSAPSGTGPISTDQLEEIIARVIEKQYSRKIETMLAAVIQKAVAREIRRLKEAFLDERADDL